MAFDRQSDYALNKKTEDIVYAYSNGESDVYTKEKDPSGNPTGRIILRHRNANGGETSRVLRDDEMSEEQFDVLKAFSDEDLHRTDKSDVREYRNTVSLDSIEDRIGIEDRDDKPEERTVPAYTMSDAMAVMDGCLTPTQKRRMIMYYYNGMSMDKIAAEEGVRRHPVWKSIRAADAKVRKYLEKENKK